MTNETLTRVKIEALPTYAAQFEFYLPANPLTRATRHPRQRLSP